MHKTFIILLAIGLDLIFGDPPNRFHPVVLTGKFLNFGRHRAPQQHRFWFGAGWTVVGIALFAIPWRVVACCVLRIAWSKERNTQYAIHAHHLTSYITHYALRFTFYVLRLSFSAALLKLVLSYRNLRYAVSDVAVALRVDNLPEARRLLSWHLVSRDTSQLTGEEVAGAAIESLTENITDGLTTPLLAYALGGLPAAWGYRFVNTADSMWGYRSPEFEQLGKFPARLDDALNWLPARLTGCLIVISAWLTGQNARQAAQTMLAQHARTPSPNAGWTMSAAAGALEVTLTKRGVYKLEGGTRPITDLTIDRALRLADVGVGLVVMCSVLLVFALKNIKRKS